VPGTVRCSSIDAGRARPDRDRAVVQLEGKEASQVRRARVEAADGRHRHLDRRLRIGIQVPHRPIAGRPDHRPIEGAAVHAERPEQRVTHDLGEGPALDAFNGPELIEPVPAER
jgi:hypothetical protein